MCFGYVTGHGIFHWLWLWHLASALRFSILLWHLAQALAVALGSGTWHLAMFVPPCWGDRLAVEATFVGVALLLRTSLFKDHLVVQATSSCWGHLVLEAALFLCGRPPLLGPPCWGSLVESAFLFTLPCFCSGCLVVKATFVRAPFLLKHLCWGCLIEATFVEVALLLRPPCSHLGGHLYCGHHVVQEADLGVSCLMITKSWRMPSVRPSVYMGESWGRWFHDCWIFKAASSSWQNPKDGKWMRIMAQFARSHFTHLLGTLTSREKWEDDRLSIHIWFFIRYVHYVHFYWKW